MVLREHTLDLTERVEQMDERLAEIDEEKDVIEERARRKVEEDELEEPPKEESNDWEDLDNEEVALRGERWKFIETVVVWSGETDVVVKHPEATGADERSVYDLSKDDIKETYGTVEKCVIRVKELTFGQLQRVSDDMMEESFEVDVQREEVEGTPRQGFYQTELLHEAIIDWPENAPVFTDEYKKDHPSPGDYPIPVSEWLFEKVDALNTTGDTEMGNSSLKEAMKFKN